MEPRKRRRASNARAKESSTPSTPPDLISSLPADVLLSILSFLPLRDAARTTALAKTPWRPLFCSLPHLFFDDSILSPAADDEEEEEGGGVDYRLPDVIVTVLASRRFQSVSVCHIDCGFFEADDVLDEIVHGLCQNGTLQELVLKNSYHAEPEPLFVPSHDILCCRSLVRLELDHCTIDVPDDFDGLQCLKQLVLRKVELSDCELERILRCCRALERSVLSDCYILEKVYVCSQSLLALEISSSSMFDVSVKDTGVLRDVSVSFLYGDELLDGDEFYEYENMLVRERRKLIRILTELVNVEVLKLQFGEEFSDVLVQMPERLPQAICLSNLKKLVIVLDFLDSSFHSLLSCLLNSSPNLEELGVEAKGCSDMDSPNYVTTYWDRQNPAECVKHHLRHAWFDQVDHCLEEFLDLVKFLLLNAEVLEKITLKPPDELEIAMELELSLLIEPWASSSAVLEFKT